MHVKKYFYLFISLFILLQIFYSKDSYAQTTTKPYKDKLELVESKLKMGDIDAALKILDEILIAYPDAAEIFYAKSIIYGQNRAFDIAISAAKSAYELDKHNLLYAKYLIDLYKSQGDLASSLLMINELIDMRPNNSELHREKILLLHTSKQSDLALTSYEDAVKILGPSDTLDILKAEILVDLKRYDEAKPILLEWQRKASPLRQVYSTLGYLYLQENNVKQAVAVLQNGLTMSKDDLLYLDLADALLTYKKDDQAFNALLSAFKSDQVDYLDKHRVMQTVMGGENKLTIVQKQALVNELVLKYPRIADAHIYKADLLWQRNQLTEARSIYLTAIGINPRHVDAWRKLINVELALNDYKSAINHGLEAININPNNAIINYFTGLSYLLNKNTDKARQYFEEALNYSTNENNYVQSMIYGSLGDLYHEINMQSASDVAYEEAIRLDEENSSVLNNYAYYLALRKKDLINAAKYAKKANEIDPSSGTFQDTYAWVLFQLGNYPEAIVWIEKAIKNSNASSILYDHYGDILIQNGREREAIKQWTKALSLISGDDKKSEKIKLKISEKKYID